VPLGVDADTFSPNGGRRDGYILSVGALHPLKGHQFVIEALASLPAPRPRLVIVADRGDLGPALAALADARGVELELRTGVPLPELVELYRRAEVVACGQIREPFGLVPLEAMATGTPVVAVAEGGFLETIEDGRTGLLAPRRPEAFATAVRRVLDGTELAAELRARGREAAVARTWERTARGFDALLERVAAGGRRPPAR
jgi:glycosyltransferase involved in cell wall biosynthesis